METLGPDVTGAVDLAREARSWLADRDFDVETHVDERVVILQATRSGWKHSLKGKRKALVIRLQRIDARWKGEATLADWRHNLAFFVAGALLGPVGLGGAALSAASRLLDPDLPRDLFAFLRAILVDRAGGGPRLPD